MSSPCACSRSRSQAVSLSLSNEPSNVNETESSDGIVLVMVIVEEVLVDRHGMSEIERTDAENLAEVDLGVARTHDLRGGVHAAHARLERAEMRLVDQVGLVENDAVGRHDLVDRLVVDAVKRVVVEVLADVLRVRRASRRRRA